MDILTRKEAREKLSKIYFTGQPCVNGHIAYRYTQSGTCSQCVKSANSPVAAPDQGARKEAKAQLVQLRVRIYEEDRDSVAAGVWALAAMRWPMLTQGDVDPRQLPKDRAAGTALYAFNCHEADIGAVREIAAESVRRRGIDAEAARAQALKAAGSFGRL